MAAVITLMFLMLLIAVAVAGYGLILYNGLVQVKHAVDQAYANIDVLLKQRHDELPKLVETCRQYMQFERGTLEKVMEARAAASSARERGDVKGVGAAEGMMRAGLGTLLATAEAYPELKSNQSIQAVLGRVTGLENAISDRREFYNEAVNRNNVRIEEFPDVVVARLLNFGPRDLLEFSEDEKKDVDVKALFSST